MTESAPVGPYHLPPLPFGYDALQPVIDAETMRLHHDLHHQGYVDQLNAALARHPEWNGLTIEELLRRLDDVPGDIRAVISDQGGGHANHQFFWKILTPQPQSGPAGELRSAIEAEWGSVEAFQSAFETAGMSVFGSGWVFLMARPRRGFRLEIIALPNQGSLLTLPEPGPGLLACDVWEHAYYLGYRNRRADWLRAWWRLVRWDYVGERLAGIRAGRKQL